MGKGAMGKGEKGEKGPGEKEGKREGKRGQAQFMLVVRSGSHGAVFHSGCERLSLIGPAERLGQRAIEEGDEIADTLLQILHRREVASA